MCSHRKPLCHRSRTGGRPSRSLRYSPRTWDKSVMTVTLKEARTRLGDLVNTARLSGEPTTITRYGKPEVVVVPVTWYDDAVARLEAAN